MITLSSRQTHRFLIHFLMAIGWLSPLAMAHNTPTTPIPSPTSPASPKPAPPPVAFDETDLDRKVSPCEDFYQFACGGWEAKTEIPADRAGWSRGFYAVDQRNEDLLHQELEAFAKNPAQAKNDEQRKLGDYYATCSDEAKRETASVATLQSRLALIDAIKNNQDLAAVVAKIQLEGADVLFSFGSTQDFKDSSLMIAEADQGGIGLPDRDYYLNRHGKMPEIRKLYQEHIQTMLTLLGEPAATAAKEATTVLGFETELAKIAMDRVQRRDPAKVYHRLERAGLEKLTPAFAWDAYFAALGYPKIKELNVTSPAYFKGLNSLLKKMPLASLRTYLRWHVLSDAAEALSEKFENEDFHFSAKALTGQTEIPARWKRCVNATLYAMPQPVGHVFVDKTFGGNSKEEAQTMIRGIESVMARDLENIVWMDKPTRQQALKKLARVVNQIGYPDKWRDYSGLAISRQSFLENAWAATTFNIRYELDKIGKPVDRTEWGMPPSMVNAYYTPTNNKMVFPAGILQAPFFNQGFPEAVNHGGIGMVMGHELTHGFDDEGRKFDADGNMRDWWTPRVAKEFDKRTACLVDQYNRYVAIDDLHVNGKLTLGENIADQGGIKLSYGAWQAKTGGKGDTVHGFSPQQQFFIAFAQSWCTKMRPESQRMRITTDPHAPPRFRVNGPLSNFKEFADAFACPAKSRMIPAQRCDIW